MESAPSSYAKLDVYLKCSSPSPSSAALDTEAKAEFAHCLLVHPHDKHEHFLHEQGPFAYTRAELEAEGSSVSLTFTDTWTSTYASELSASSPISIPRSSSSRSVHVGHSRVCPALLTRASSSSSPLATCTSLLRVAVCVLAVHKGHVLVARRASHSRTFPLRWVLPGGHVDEGESLLEAGVREVHEETGLRVHVSRPVACWESCYPTYLEQGAVQRHHLVIYLEASVLDLDLDLDSALSSFESLRLDASEVDMLAWLPLSDLDALCSESDLETETEAEALVGTLPALTVDAESGAYSTVAHPKERLRLRSQREMLQGQGRGDEGLSLGSAFALLAWRGFHDKG